MWRSKLELHITIRYRAAWIWYRNQRACVQEIILENHFVANITGDQAAPSMPSTCTYPLEVMGDKGDSVLQNSERPHLALSTSTCCLTNTHRPGFILHKQQRQLTKFNYNSKAQGSVTASLLKFLSNLMFWQNAPSSHRFISKRRFINSVNLRNYTSTVHHCFDLDYKIS